jgi:DNA-3-methyladenine glycosylase
MSRSRILDKSFYLQDDVVDIARNLLGKKLVTCFQGQITSGVIVETEAYAGVNDRASHAYGGKITRRNKIMYSEGGVAYVYLCYGIHSLFNVVTNVSGIPHAVLIRGILPHEGIEEMKLRSGRRELKLRDGIGPGKVSKLLGIHYSHSGLPLTFKGPDSSGIQIWIEHAISINDANKASSPRIGVDYAGEDALLPYRFSTEIKKAP